MKKISCNETDCESNRSCFCKKCKILIEEDAKCESYRKKDSIASVKYIQNNNKELPFYIENCINYYENITICANENGFNTLSRILATLTSDTIELKFDTLMPSQAIKFSKNSFLIDINNSKINLIKAESTKELPEILTQDEQNSKIFHIIDIDKESAQILLEPLTATYNVNIALTQIIDGLTKIKVSASKYGHIDSFIDSVANLFIGNLGEKARKLFDAGKISEGHYIEILNKLNYADED